MDESIRTRKPTDPPPPQEGAGPQLDLALLRLVQEMTAFDAIVVRKAAEAGATDEAARAAAVESRAIASDLAYNRLKNTGGLQRAEADRALAMQIDRQGAANFTTTGLWA